MCRHGCSSLAYALLHIPHPAEKPDDGLAVFDHAVANHLIELFAGRPAAFDTLVFHRLRIARGPRAGPPAAGFRLRPAALPATPPDTSRRAAGIGARVRCGSSGRPPSSRP